MPPRSDVAHSRFAGEDAACTGSENDREHQRGGFPEGEPSLAARGGFTLSRCAHEFYRGQGSIDLSVHATAFAKGPAEASAARWESPPPA